VKIDNLEATILKELGKGTPVLTIATNILSTISRASVREKIKSLKDRGILLTHAGVNPVKVFENVVLVLVELEEIGGLPKNSIYKEYGLKQVVEFIQTNSPKVIVILGFVIDGGRRYDFGLMLGIEDLEKYKQLLAKFSEIKIFKDISTFPISASSEFYFNPSALPIE
jgi:DNA-binding Lrp family transcriptional regulator